MIALAAVFGFAILLVVAFGTCKNGSGGLERFSGIAQHPASKMDLAVRDLSRARATSDPVSPGAP